MVPFFCYFPLVLCLGSTPLDSTGLVFQLETDSGITLSGNTVTGWNDQSGLANHLTAGGDPTLLANELNGLPAIHFDGVGDKLDRGVFSGLPTGPSDRTVFLLARFHDIGPGGFSYGHVGCNTSFGLIVRPPVGDLQLTGYCTAADQSTAEPGTNTGWLIYSVVLSGNVQRQFRDGRPIDSGLQIYATGNSKIILGAEIDESPYVNMDVGAVLVYDHALSDPSHADVVEYLREKYLGDRAPAAIDDVARAPRGGTIAIDVAANDLPGDEVDVTTVTIITPPARGFVTVDTVTGLVSYQHYDITMLPDTFEYTIDNLSGQTSAPATVRIGVDDPTCPLITSGLALHLDAGLGVRIEGAGVHSWADLSPQQVQLEAFGSPTLTPGQLNGHDVITLDGLDDKIERLSGLEGFSFGSDDRSIFFVVNYLGASGAAGVSYGRNACNTTFGLVTNTLGNLMLLGWCAPNDFPTTTATAGGFLVQSGVVEGGWFQHSLNGIQIDNQQHSFGTSGDRFVIGAEITGTTHVPMQVAEVLVYGRALSIAERGQVVDHLRAKYFDELCSTPCLAPIVSLGPVPTATCVGASFQLTVAATGTPPFLYQWRQNGIDIPGATGDVYTAPAAAPGDAGLYDVVISNPCGATTSESVEVIIAPSVAIVTQPTPQLGCVGSAISLSVGATGDRLTYQWRHDGVPVAGATSANLLLTNLTGSEAGDYDVVVSGPCGTATSNAAPVAVHTAAEVATPPANTFACIGDSVQLSVVPAGTPPFFIQWQKDGETIDGVIGATLDIVNATAADSGDYAAIVNNSCASVTSAVATVMFTDGPAISSSPVDSYVCLGGNIDLSVTATGGGRLTYQWIKNGLPMVGATDSMLTVSGAQSSDAGTYIVEVSDGCSTAASAPFTLSLDALPQVTSHPQPTTVCAGQFVSLSVGVDSLSPLTYQWRRNGLEILGATASSYTLHVATLADAGLYDVVVTNACNFVTTLPVPLDVEDCSQFRRGDCNIDGGFNIADVIFLLGFSFPGMTGPNVLECEDACDCNDDGALNIADAVCFLGFLFGSPPVAPAPPFNVCDYDPTDDDPLDCDEFPCP